MNEFEWAGRPARRTLVLSLLGLAGFLALQALLIGRYVAEDTRPPAWDQSIHLEIALDYRELLAQGRLADAWFLPPKPGMPPFPPAYHLLLSRAYASDDPARAALWLNWLYMALLAFSLFAVAWRHLPDARALAGVVIFCASPGVQDLATTQLVDLAVCAWAAACYAALVWSDGLTRWGPVLGLGALHAAGMLHKWSFFSYMLPAYYVALRALADHEARPKLAAAFLLSAALFVPWYASHIALLPSRLVQASSDFAIPFWRANAWAAYFQQGMAAFGPLVFALGLLGLALPQWPRRRDEGWVLSCWALFSWIFWTIVPNRQMRFLLPGLAAIGPALAASWPRPVVWLTAGLQLAAMANFHYGWIGPLRLEAPLVPLVAFENQPPAREDWRIETILRRVEKERDPSRPLTNVTLVANDVHFNAPAFHWARRRLGVSGVRIRGVTKRLSELSEFVVLKDGRLGPPTVIPGLPEAAKVVKDPESWFALAYERLDDWPLPDGSIARLYRQRRFRSRPLKNDRLESAFFLAPGGGVRALSVRLSGWESSRSMWAKGSASAERLELRGLVLRGLAVRMENFSFVPRYEGADVYDVDDLRLTRLDRLKLDKLTVEAQDLKAFLEKRVKGLELDEVSIDGSIKASGRWNGRRVAAEAALELDREARRLKVRVVSASYMGTPLPLALFKPIKELSVSLEPNPETPFFIELPGLTAKDGRLTVP